MLRSWAWLLNRVAYDAKTGTWATSIEQNEILRSSMLHDHAFGRYLVDFDRSILFTKAYKSWIGTTLEYNRCFSHKSSPLSTIINDSTSKRYHRHHESSPLCTVHFNCSASYFLPEARLSLVQTFEFSWVLKSLTFEPSVSICSNIGNVKNSRFCLLAYSKLWESFISFVQIFEIAINIESLEFIISECMSSWMHNEFLCIWIPEFLLRDIRRNCLKRRLGFSSALSRCTRFHLHRACICTGPL